MKTEKKRTLKGSVLFTVVSVLALMIVFMTSALALASAANKRARKSYASSQTTYTARAAIDSILAAVGTDGNFATAVSNLSAGGTLNVEVGINDARLGRIESATISHAGTKAVFDPVSKKWIEKNILKITAEVTLGGETSTVTSHIIQDPVTKNEDGPGFLTMGGADVDNHSSVFGGSYVGMNWSDGGVGANYQTYQYIDWIPPFNPGDTGELVTLDDKKYRSGYNFHTQNEQSNEAPVAINGNFTISNPSHYYFTKKGKGIDIWGDLKFDGDQCKLAMDAAPELQRALTFIETPYIFVDGEFYSNAQNLHVGDGSFPLNFFCDKFTIKTSGTPDFHCDFYALDKNDTSTYSVKGSALYKWAGSIKSGGNAYETMGGSLYSKGNIEISLQNGNDMEIAGNVIAEGNVTLTSRMDNGALDTETAKNKKLVIDGDLVVGGELHCDLKKVEVKGNIYAGSVTGDGANLFRSSTINSDVTVQEKDALLARRIRYYQQPDQNNIQTQEWAWITQDCISAVPCTKKSENGKEYYDFEGTGPALNDYTLITQNVDDTRNNKYIVKWNGNRDEAPPKYKEYYRNGVKIEEAEAFGLPSINEYRTAHDGCIFPKFAEKEVLLGIKGPIKGTEGHFMTDALKTEHYSEMVSNTYHGGGPIVGTITDTCCITGVVDKEVKIEAVDHDVYVLLKDVNFKNETNPTLPKITVKEYENYHVYFAFEGEIETNYFNQAELDSTKLISTVQEVMTTWDIEQNIKTPGDLDLSDESQMQAYIKMKEEAVEPENNVLDFTDARMTANGKNGIGIIKGTIDKKVIKIIPSNQSNWVIIDKVTLQNGAKIIVDDTAGTGIVNFFIDTYLTCGGSDSIGYWGGPGICTQKFWNFIDGTETRQIRSDLTDASINTTYGKAGMTPPSGKTENSPIPDIDPINVNIYSSKYIPSTLSGTNGAMFTAFIRAPYLDVTLSTLSRAVFGQIKNRLYYDGVQLKDIQNTHGDWAAAVVGCLNVKSMTCGEPWLLLYQKPSDGSAPVTDANGEHLYAAVDYLDY